MVRDLQPEERVAGLPSDPLPRGVIFSPESQTFLAPNFTFQF